MLPMSLPQSAPDMAQTVHRITLPGGETFACREQESVLAAMLRAGCGPIRCGCFGGGCGACRMRVAAGNYTRLQPMSRAHVPPEAAGTGAVLLCCIAPLGDLLLENA